MAFFSRSSGIVTADRRYDYARHSAAEGDHAAAADLLAQAVAIAPDWVPAWFALGEALEATGDLAGAVAAFARALELDAEDGFGAGLRLARLGARPRPNGPPDAYVRGLFDQYADRFERHLVEDLAYCGPAVLSSAIARAGVALSRSPGFDTMLDLGCGTGLMAREMHSQCAAIDGVDIAPAMVAKARETGLYRRVDVGDVRGFLGSYADRSVDLVLAADVFVYVGALDQVFVQAARVLAPHGLFAFSVQSTPGEGFELGKDLRYLHSRLYLETRAAANDLRVVACDEASVRQDRGIPVSGLALVMATP